MGLPASVWVQLYALSPARPAPLSTAPAAGTTRRGQEPSPCAGRPKPRGRRAAVDFGNAGGVPEPAQLGAGRSLLVLSLCASPVLARHEQVCGAAGDRDAARPADLHPSGSRYEASGWRAALWARGQEVRKGGVSCAF